MSRYLTKDGDLKVSASSMDTFEQCPRKWMHIYVEDAKSVANFHTIVGSFTHAVLEELYLWDPEERTVDLAKEIARYEWDKMNCSWASSRLGRDLNSLRLDEHDARLMRQKAWSSIKGIWEMEIPSDVDVVDVEREFYISHDGAWIRGFIDRVERVDGGLRISDYKSGKPPAQRYKNQKLFQVYLYAKAAEEVYNEPVVSAALLFLGKEIVEGAVTQAVLNRTDKKLSKTIGEMKVALASKEFKPKTGPLCAWCDFLPWCQDGVEKVLELHSYGRVRIDSPGAQLLGLD